MKTNIKTWVWLGGACLAASAIAIAACGSFLTSPACASLWSSCAGTCPVCGIPTTGMVADAQHVGVRNVASYHRVGERGMTVYPSSPCHFVCTLGHPACGYPQVAATGPQEEILDCPDCTVGGGTGPIE